MKFFKTFVHLNVNQNVDQNMIRVPVRHILFFYYLF